MTNCGQSQNAKLIFFKNQCNFHVYRIIEEIHIVILIKQNILTKFYTSSQQARNRGEFLNLIKFASDTTHNSCYNYEHGERLNVPSLEMKQQKFSLLSLFLYNIKLKVPVSELNKNKKQYLCLFLFNMWAKTTQRCRK